MGKEILPAKDSAGLGRDKITMRQEPEPFVHLLIGNVLSV